MNIDSTQPLMSQAGPVDPTKVPAEQRLYQLRKASVDFESMLLKQMFQSMEKTLGSQTMVGGGLSGSIYSDMMMQAVSDDMASNQSLGLAEKLYKDVVRSDPELKKLPETQGFDKGFHLLSHRPGISKVLEGEGVPSPELKRRNLENVTMGSQDKSIPIPIEAAKNADNTIRNPPILMNVYGKESSTSINHKEAP